MDGTFLMYILSLYHFDAVKSANQDSWLTQRNMSHQNIEEYTSMPYKISIFKRWLSSPVLVGAYRNHIVKFHTDFKFLACRLVVVSIRRRRIEDLQRHKDSHRLLNHRVHSTISESKFRMIAPCSLNGAACRAEISSRSLGVRMMR